MHRLLESCDKKNARARLPIGPLQTRLKAGTVLVREWHGTTHRVTVLDDGFRFGGKRYRSLSEVARTITGSRWSGPLFFGLKSASTEHDPWSRVRQRFALRDLYAQVFGRRSGAGLQFAARAARGLRSLHQQSGGRRLAAGQDRITTMAVFPARRWSDRRCSVCSPISSKA